MYRVIYSYGGGTRGINGIENVNPSPIIGLGGSINYVVKQRGEGFNQKYICLCNCVCSKLVNKRGRGVINLQNLVKVVYECPLSAYKGNVLFPLNT